MKQIGILEWYRWSGSLLREDRTALYIMQQQTKGTSLIQDHVFVMVKCMCLWWFNTNAYSKRNSITLEEADKPTLPHVVPLIVLFYTQKSYHLGVQNINKINNQRPGMPEKPKSESLQASGLFTFGQGDTLLKLSCPQGHSMISMSFQHWVDT